MLPVMLPVRAGRGEGSCEQGFGIGVGKGAVVAAGFAPGGARLRAAQPAFRNADRRWRAACAAGERATAATQRRRIPACLPPPGALLGAGRAPALRAPQGRAARGQTYNAAP